MEASIRNFLGERRICVTGGAGFLGRAVWKRLCAHGAERVFVPRSAEYNLTSREAVRGLFQEARPEIVIHLAAQVGGIGANQLHPGHYFYANLAMGLNLIEEARLCGIEKFVQVGTVCSYPADCPVPFREDDLWRGYPEETNAPYGVAKRALGVMLDAYAREYGFKSAYVIPVNLYGPGDNFDLESSHVIPALIRKVCDAARTSAAEVECWGSGEATREFLYVDDAAEAIVRAAALVDRPIPINLGSGREIGIAALAERISLLCGFRGRITWNRARPDGQRRRRLDTTRASTLLDWRAGVDLDEGLRRTILWWRDQSNSLAQASKDSVFPAGH